MPLYEYQCQSCEKIHEVMQKFSDDPLTTCPECAGPVKKLMSMTSFALKGTGWYATDYKKSSKAPTTDAGPANAPTTGPANVTAAAPAVEKSAEKSVEKAPTPPASGSAPNPKA